MPSGPLLWPGCPEKGAFFPRPADGSDRAAGPSFPDRKDMVMPFYFLLSALWVGWTRW